MNLLFTVFVSWKSKSVCIILYINSTKVIEKAKSFIIFIVNFKFCCMSYILEHLSLIFKKDYSLCLFLRSPR